MADGRNKIASNLKLYGEGALNELLLELKRFPTASLQNGTFGKISRLVSHLFLSNTNNRELTFNILISRCPSQLKLN